MKAKSTRANRLSILISCGVLGAAGALALPHLDTSALSYQTGATISFTFNPSLTVSISDDLTISSLAPGSYADSNIINVGVVTNAINGYVLQATAGTNSTTNRLVNTDSSSYYFESLGVNETVGTMGSANDNTWGYSYSTDNGTTWISAPSTLGYSGLPQDANTIAAERGKGGKTLIDTNDSASNQSIKFKIGAKAATTQATGEYTNTINFYAVTYPEPEPVSTLYDNVAAMSKGKQTAAQLQEVITVPTSADRSQDTSNSGVYEYDPSVFGTASDASNDNKIYYYRGVLENSVGSYGSDGSAVTYPNYVVLSSAADSSGLTTTDTCWRIVRTTGSGGVKMIYNGLYGATTAGSCANKQTNAQVATSAFNGTLSTYQQIVRVGYTYNSTYATNTASTATIASVLGSDSNPAVNDARSNIKTYIEDTWYAGNMTSYTGILEPSAGYCNDRTVYDNTSPYTLQPESTNIVTYGTSDMTYYRFGSNIRNFLTLANNNNRTITLNCARSTVDLYRYNGTNGAAGSTTANYLKYPAALLTADEAAFAGSGSSPATQGSAYHANSFLRSGPDFWLLSPSYRGSGGSANEFRLYSSGGLSNDYVHSAFGVRPAISLTSGTTAVSGSGTATDPWVVNPPSS